MYTPISTTRYITSQSRQILNLIKLLSSTTNQPVSNRRKVGQYNVAGIFADRYNLGKIIIGLLVVILLQGCIHTQPPKIYSDISITALPAPNISNSNISEQVIGQFVVTLHSGGAFLEGIQFNTPNNSTLLSNVRVRMSNDDQWLTPAEINIYLDPEQQHHFEIAATVTGHSQGFNDTPNAISFNLSKFRFLTSEAITLVDHSILSYSLATDPPQQSRT